MLLLWKSLVNWLVGGSHPAQFFISFFQESSSAQPRTMFFVSLSSGHSRTDGGSINGSLKPQESQAEGLKISCYRPVPVDRFFSPSNLQPSPLFYQKSPLPPLIWLAHNAWSPSPPGHESPHPCQVANPLSHSLVLPIEFSLHRGQLWVSLSFLQAQVKSFKIIFIVVKHFVTFRIIFGGCFLYCHGAKNPSYVLPILRDKDFLCRQLHN